ncbi:MAG: hypothetical protein WCR04_06300 [Fibrobacteraceae bacterium]
MHDTYPQTGKFSVSLQNKKLYPALATRGKKAIIFTTAQNKNLISCKLSKSDRNRHFP